jgi:hypothetical protein
MNEENRKAYRILMRKPQVKRPLGRPIRRWVDNIKMNPGVVWTGLIWLRIVISGGIL